MKSSFLAGEQHASTTSSMIPRDALVRHPERWSIVAIMVYVSAIAMWGAGAYLWFYRDNITLKTLAMALATTIMILSALVGTLAARSFDKGGPVDDSMKACTPADIKNVTEFANSNTAYAKEQRRLAGGKQALIDATLNGGICQMKTK